MPLSDIVNVSIDRQTRAVSAAGFGTMLIAGFNGPQTAGSDVRYYSDMDGVEADYPAGTEEHAAAAAAFAQTPAPTTVAIAHRAGSQATSPAEVHPALRALASLPVNCDPWLAE